MTFGKQDGVALLPICSDVENKNSINASPRTFDAVVGELTLGAIKTENDRHVGYAVVVTEPIFLHGQQR
jgi:hypothetical protein